MNRNMLSALIIALSVLSGVARAQTADLNKFSVNPATSTAPARGQGGIDVLVNGISADGSVIVGSFRDANKVEHAYRWTESGGAQDLGTMGGTSASATGASADGSVIVGDFRDGHGVVHVFRWSESRGAEDLGAMGGDVKALSVGVSADGSVIVGIVFNWTANLEHAFRWTQSAGAQSLDTPGQNQSIRGVSADGSVIVGSFFGPLEDGTGNSAAEAAAVDAATVDLGAMGRIAAARAPQIVENVYRWTAAGGTQNLGTLGMSGQEAWVTGVSADGSAIVGNFTDTQGHGRAQVHRWTASGGAENLGSLGIVTPPNRAFAWGVSADGSVIGGVIDTAQKISHVVRWTQSGGAQDLGAIMGIWSGLTGGGVSADGSVVAGNFMDLDHGSAGAVLVGHAFRWTRSGGTQDLSSTCSRQGVGKRSI